MWELAIRNQRHFASAFKSFVVNARCSTHTVHYWTVEPEYLHIQETNAITTLVSEYLS